MIRPAILRTIVEVTAQQNKQLARLTDDLPLMQSGLDSLCIAVLIASLDDQLELDPFCADGDVAFPVTVGDFISLYENAAV